MTFFRNPSEIWQREVPGARWFKTDLHVHTIDDHAGSRAKVPTELSGISDPEEMLQRYARLLATHNANIVVNGDADMVILLEADADHGTVACAGAIEMPEVRDAIVRTVDGGRAAFPLRRTKYGF